jgi:hypothetical protein
MLDLRLTLARLKGKTLSMQMQPTHKHRHPTRLVCLEVLGLLLVEPQQGLERWQVRQLELPLFNDKT